MRPMRRWGQAIGIARCGEPEQATCGEIRLVPVWETPGIALWLQWTQAPQSQRIGVCLSDMQRGVP